MKYTTQVQENESGDLYIEMSPEVLEKAGMSEGDTVQWTDLGDGTWTLTRKEPVKLKTEFVMVEVISTYRMRYAIEVPVGKRHEAIVKVEDGQVVEFSQLHLGEKIISDRIVSEKELLELCDEDNGYSRNWDETLQLKCFVNLLDDEE